MSIKREIDLVEEAIEQGNDEKVYNTVAKYYDRSFRRDIAALAAKYGRMDMVKELRYYFPHQIIYHFALGGHSEIVNNILDSDPNVELRTAANGAVMGGHKELLDSIIERGANCWDTIAASAAIGGHKEIVWDMVRRDPNIEEHLAHCVARGGNFELFKSIETNKTDYNCVAHSAARGGHQKLLNYAISKGANDWNKIAYDAARGGHLYILKDMVDRGANDYDLMAFYAAGYGYIDIINYLITKDPYMNPSQFNYDSHLDAKEYFKDIKGKQSVMDKISPYILPLSLTVATVYGVYLLKRNNS